jgi:hypothetical protein
LQVVMVLVCKEVNGYYNVQVFGLAAGRHPRAPEGARAEAPPGAADRGIMFCGHWGPLG